MQEPRPAPLCPTAPPCVCRFSISMAFFSFSCWSAERFAPLTGPASPPAALVLFLPFLVFFPPAEPEVAAGVFPSIASPGVPSPPSVTPFFTVSSAILAPATFALQHKTMGLTLSNICWSSFYHLLDRHADNRVGDWISLQ